MYFVHTVYLLHVSATHVAIIRDVHYKGWVLRNITEFFESMHGCYGIGSGLCSMHGRGSFKHLFYLLKFGLFKINLRHVQDFLINLPTAQLMCDTGYLAITY